LNYQEIDFDARPPGQLWRFQIDLEAGTASRRLLDQRACEFPFVNPALIGKPHHWIFLAAAHQPEGDAPHQAIFKINPESGQQDLYSFAPKGFVGEPIFVPRPGSDREDDGWVLTLVYDAARGRTDVAILDGTDLQKGPIAHLHLKHHIPYGLHGSFVPNQLDSDRH
jgi:all-trans-8'-apo-beta-carotenal 15,15'-oxygenase